MRVTDVRIGNYLTGQNGPLDEHVVISISGNRIVTQPVGMPSSVSTEPISKIDGHSSAKPTRITTEWMTKLGFKDGKLEVSPLMNLFFSEGRIFLVVEGSYTALDGIEYVHQVQNLYFSLSGKDLKLIG